MHYAPIFMLIAIIIQLLSEQHLQNQFNKKKKSLKRKVLRLRLRRVESSPAFKVLLLNLVIFAVVQRIISE